MDLQDQPRVEHNSGALPLLTIQSGKLSIKIYARGVLLGVMLVLAGSFAAIKYLPTAGADPMAQERLRISESVATANSLSAAFVSAASVVEESVVHITTVDIDGEGEAFNQSSGSGVIVDAQGYIITNYHVVKDANRIKVRLFDGATMSGNVVGFDEDADIAVVKIISTKPLKAAKIGDSDRLVVGDWVIAIGSPFGLEQTVTAGIISAKERVTDQARTFQQFLQTDAAINPGNSGGPLVNMAGEVVGINSQIATRKGSFEGIGFAVPSTNFVDIYNQLVGTGRVSRGYLGVLPAKVTPQFLQVYNIDGKYGALVNDLSDPDGPAAKAGLKSGDVIVEFDGHEIKDDNDLVRRIVATRVNTPVKLKYFRNGVSQSTTVNLVERQQTATAPLAPKPRPIPDMRPHVTRFDKDKDDNTQSRLGMDVVALTDFRAQNMGLKNVSGVIVRTVNADNVAYDAGLREGDLIKEVNKQSISKHEEYLQAINKLKSGDALVLFVERRARFGGISRRYVSLTIP